MACHDFEKGKKHNSCPSMGKFWFLLMISMSLVMVDANRKHIIKFLPGVSLIETLDSQWALP